MADVQGYLLHFWNKAYIEPETQVGRPFSVVWTVGSLNKLAWYHL